MNIIVQKVRLDLKVGTYRVSLIIGGGGGASSTFCVNKILDII